MHKTLTTVIASLAAAMLLATSSANATVYKFTFESFDSELTATGEITVNAADEVTAISGQISGLVDQTIGPITPNPNFPGTAYSPDGSFIYNNLYHPSGMALDIDGILFTTAQDPGGYWNVGEFPRRLLALGVGQFLQLPDSRERNPQRSRGAGTVHLGDAGTGLRGPRRRRSPPLAATCGGEHRLSAASPKDLRKDRLSQF